MTDGQLLLGISTVIFQIILFCGRKECVISF